MSHFEYIAVAFSLVFALILSRLLESLPSVFRSSRRYWVHALWTVHMIFSVFGLWWALWEFRDTTWTPGLFLGVMTFPVILYMRTIFLLQDHSEGEKSWEVLFFENRRAFFSTSAFAPIAALIFDLSVIESEGSAQAWRLSGYLLLLSLCLPGLISSDRRLHGALVVISFVLGLGWLGSGVSS